MSLPTHNPIYRFFACARAFANGSKYLSEYLRGLLGVTCGVEILQISLYHGPKPVRGPSEDLALKVSSCPNSATRCHLRVKSSPYQSQYCVKLHPVLVRVTPQHIHSHLASDTSSQGPRQYHQGLVCGFMSYELPGYKLSYHPSRRQSNHERARWLCRVSRPQIT